MNITKALSFLASRMRRFFGYVEEKEYNTDGGLTAIFYRNKYSGQEFVRLRRSKNVFVPLNFADNHPVLSIDVGRGIWRCLVDYANGKSVVAPRDFKYLPEVHRVIFALDGQIFSIPVEDLNQIDAYVRTHSDEY